MPTYIFDIQNCIQASIVTENHDDAREELIDNLVSFADDMITDCVVSDGEPL
jgi:hypothetical protein